MKRLFVTINIGPSVDDDVPYRIPSSWDKVVFTDRPHLYPEFECIGVSADGYPDAIVAKQIKWNIAEIYSNYDVIIYADRNIAVGNLDKQLDQIDFDTYDMALIKHRSSFSIADEIDLCRKCDRWSNHMMEWVKMASYSGFDITEKRPMYANGIMIFKPTDLVRDIHGRVSWAMQYITRDQVVFPMFNSIQPIPIQGLDWSTFNNSIFKINNIH